MSQKKLYIYNSLTGSKEKFKSLRNNSVGMYVCGPTVYSDVHLGNCRTFISFDIIFRYQDLDWKEFVEVDSTLLRKGDPLKRVSDPKKIYSLYNWKTKLGFEDLVIKCLEHRFLN